MNDDLTTPVAPKSVPLFLEAVDYTALGIDADAPVPTNLMAWCALALGQIVIDPTTVRLVLAGDFVGSINGRLEQEGIGATFDLRRNGGMVGAKTMRLGDGSIDVLLPVWYFLANEDLTTQQSLERLVKRTVVHEAHHAAMMQSGEGEQDYRDQPRAHRTFLSAADQVIGEYRAEAAVSPSLREGDSGWDLVGVLQTLRADLTRITTVDYQQHLDVGKLCESVMNEVHTTWKILAVDVARSGVESKIAAGDDRDNLEELMAGDHWPRFVEILTSIPHGGVRLAEEELERATQHLADELEDWLDTIGFTFTDEPEGAIKFIIKSFDLFV